METQIIEQNQQALSSVTAPMVVYRERPSKPSLLDLEPDEMLAKAGKMATALRSIITDRKLYTVFNNKAYVHVSGWSTLGSMVGIVPREVGVQELEDGSYLATVELIRASDGMVVGRASSLCGMDEKTWSNKPKYARRSMSVTRATGKAYRLGLGWVMNLAGYEATPAEELPVEDKPEPRSIT